MLVCMFKFVNMGFIIFLELYTISTVIQSRVRILYHIVRPLIILGLMTCPLVSLCNLLQLDFDVPRRF